MAMGKLLYAQGVMIRRNCLDNKEFNEKNKKYNFQGQSTRSIRLFDLDHEWLEESFSTRETGFYLKNQEKN